VPNGTGGLESFKLLARSWHDRRTGGQLGQAIWFHFWVIMAARAVGLGTLGGMTGGWRWAAR
jgi:hypothetical protein